MALGRALAIPAEERIGNVHARDDFSKGRKALAIEPGIVAEIDEHLGRARIGTPGGEGDHAASVTLLYGVVLDIGVAPHRRDLRVAVDAELRHEAVEHPEETRVVVE